MLTQRDLLAVAAERERRQDDIAWAEKGRLIRHVMYQDVQAAHGHQRGLARLGHLLVRWGRELQTWDGSGRSISAGID
jgi:hypothetical protein